MVCGHPQVSPTSHALQMVLGVVVDLACVGFTRFWRVPCLRMQSMLVVRTMQFMRWVHGYVAWCCCSLPNVCLPFIAAAWLHYPRHCELAHVLRHRTCEAAGSRPYVSCLSPHVIAVPVATGVVSSLCTHFLHESAAGVPVAHSICTFGTGVM